MNLTAIKSHKKRHEASERRKPHHDLVYFYKDQLLVLSCGHGIAIEISIDACTFKRPQSFKNDQEGKSWM